MTPLILALIAGAVVGLSLGALGGGGSVLAVPALIYLLGFTPDHATTASLLADLADASRDRGRDAFGRVVRDEGDDFPFAWLRAGLHVREFTRATARRAWLASVEDG